MKVKEMGIHLTWVFRCHGVLHWHTESFFLFFIIFINSSVVWMIRKFTFVEIFVLFFLWGGPLNTSYKEHFFLAQSSCHFSRLAFPFVMRFSREALLLSVTNGSVSLKNVRHNLTRFAGCRGAVTLQALNLIH